MPYKESKTIKGLITHYGKWSKKEEDAFYQIFSFNDWRGTHMVTSHPSSSKSMESQESQVDIDSPPTPS